MVLTEPVVLSVAVLLVWAYNAIQPPPPLICGSPGGPPITSPRIQLKDGRNMSYREEGVPREKARYKIIFIHGFASSKEDGFPASKEMVEELGIYMVHYDRAGYGESDPNPRRSLKSDAMDVQELADKLQLGEKFYVAGTSMGGSIAWSCLNYIPQRLEGVALVVPVVNYFWPGLPANLSKSVFSNLDARDQTMFWIAHNLPFLVHAWMTQKWFPLSPAVAGAPEAFTEEDMALLQKKQEGMKPFQGRATRQGIYESLCRDLITLFGDLGLEPMNIENPFPEKKGAASIWQGYEDRFVPVELQRYVAEKLPWIQYFEEPDGGHLFMLRKGYGDKILKMLLLQEEPSDLQSYSKAVSAII